MIKIIISIKSNGEKGVTNCNTKAIAEGECDKYEQFIADDLLDTLDTELTDIYNFLENRNEKE